jgi:clan AA aspartic protease
MGEVIERITLVNTRQTANAADGFIKEADIKQVKLRALVDAGATNIVISEKIRQKLGLEVKETRRVILGDGREEICGYTEWVTVRWKDREAVCQAVVFPHAKETLLGVIPLEQMDLKINLKAQKLEGAHGDEVVWFVRSLRSR